MAGTTERLTPLIEAALERAEKLRATLEEERASLLRRDMEALERMAEQKAVLTAELDALGRAQTEVLSAAEGVDLAHWMELPEAESLRPHWQSLVAALEACQQVNRINGGIVDLLQRHTRRAVAILEGGGPGNELYGRSGEADPLVRSRYNTSA